MSRALKHLDWVIRDQKAAPVSIDQPHFLFDSPCDLPAFGEHQLTVIELPEHLGEMKRAEWDCAEVPPSLAGIDLGGLQLEAQA